MRPAASRWHNGIGQLNPDRIRVFVNCHSFTGQTRNCHQTFRFVWWPHSVLSDRRAISYSAGERHTGINAALQPDLFCHSRTALPTWTSLAEYTPAGNADRLAPKHDQQGLSPVGDRWRSGSDGRIRHLCPRPAKTTRFQNPAPHPQSRSEGSGSRGPQMRGWAAKCRLYTSTN